MRDRHKPAKVMLLSTYGPLFAEKSSGFSDCHRLRSYEETRYHSKRTAVSEDLTAKPTSCALEPFLGTIEANLTIDSDGVTLRPFLTCISHSPLVAFNKILHGWGKGSWVPVKHKFNLEKNKIRGVSYTIHQQIPRYRHQRIYQP